MCRTLLADVMLSSSTKTDGALHLPSGAYVAPERLRAMSAQPVAFCRKVIELGPKLVILWSGSREIAQTFANIAEAKIRNVEATETNIQSVLHDLEYDTRGMPSHARAGFSAIFAPSDSLDIFWHGSVAEGDTRVCGRYVSAGSGTASFEKMATAFEELDEGRMPPDKIGLQIANDFLAQEIHTGTPMDDAFGGAFEVIVRGPDGYQRLDDIVHAFTDVMVDGRRNIHVEPHPQVMRQWYEDDCLYVTTLVAPEIAAQGLPGRNFRAPSLLGLDRDFNRPLETFRDRPRYFCLHHLIRHDGKETPATLILKGEEIGEAITFEHLPDRFTMSFTAKYLGGIQKFVNEVIRR